MLSSALERIVVRSCLASLALFGVANAGSHLWRINEIFSNADGTVQFIELKESAGSSFETALAGKNVVSVSTGNSFVIPSNVAPPTANKHLLFATAAFAALPGAPTPNYTIPAGFFNPAGYTIDWAPAFNYDTFTFGAGQLPIDGVNAIRVTNYNTDTFVTEANTPTNYAGQTGTVNAGPPVPAMSTIGFAVALAGMFAAGAIVLRRRSATTA